MGWSRKRLSENMVKEKKERGKSSGGRENTITKEKIGAK